jgi:hypothetical protein
MVSAFGICADSGLTTDNGQYERRSKATDTEQDQCGARSH